MTNTIMDLQVQKLQAMLYAKASHEPMVRFSRLYRQMLKPHWAWAAAQKVLSNRGSRTAGVDGKARSDYLEEGERWKLVMSVLDELDNQTYRPSPVRRVYIPKPNGKMRPLGIPTLKDRIVQEMVRMLIEPIYEATFLPCSYGFRPNRSTWDALAETYQFLRPQRQYYTVIEGDIENCFGTIQHGLLMKQLQRRIGDAKLLALIWKMLRAGVMEDLQYSKTTEGTPQGGIISPLLANVYMHQLDEWMHQRFYSLKANARNKRRRKGDIFACVRYIRYADDFILLVRESQAASILKQELADYIKQEMQMTLSEEKTLITDAREVGFDFLGEHVYVAPQRSNPNRLLPFFRPSKKSVQAYRRKVKELTRRDLGYLHPAERIRVLNWLITGWANYHHWGNAKETFKLLGYWTTKKVFKMLRRYSPQGGRRPAYDKYFRPLSEYANMEQYRQYTQWKAPGVETGRNTHIGLIPMGIISTARNWLYRGNKIPPAYRLLGDETKWFERDADFRTDLDIIQNTTVDASSECQKKHGPGYASVRKLALKRDQYTCTDCGYQSERRNGEVHDLEVHHIDPMAGNGLENLRTVCIPCHLRLTSNAG